MIFSFWKYCLRSVLKFSTVPKFANRTEPKTEPKPNRKKTEILYENWISRKLFFVSAKIVLKMIYWIGSSSRFQEPRMSFSFVCVGVSLLDFASIKFLRALKRRSHGTAPTGMDKICMIGRTRIGENIMIFYIFNFRFGSFWSVRKSANRTENRTEPKTDTKNRTVENSSLKIIHLKYRAG